jgi:hypothetical protein
MDEMKTGSVVIFVDSENKTDWEKIPIPVRNAIRSPEAGKYIPKLIVTDSTASNVVGVVGYTDLKGDKALNAVKRKLKEIKASIPALTASTVNSLASASMEPWTNTEGKTITAAYVSATSTAITLKLQNGSTVVVPMEKLSADSQKRALELIAK